MGRYPRFCSVARSVRIEVSSSQCNATRTGPSEDLDVIWYGVTQDRQINLGQRFKRLNYQCAAPIDDFLIVQIRLPLRQMSQFFKLRFCDGSGYELVIVFENA